MILEHEIMGLPVDKKKILIDYSSELSTEDRLKIASYQDSMMNDIIENSGHHHYYILSNNSESIKNAIIQSKIEYTQIDCITNPQQHRYAFESEFIMINGLMKADKYDEFIPVIRYSSDVYKYGYNDVSMFLKLARVAQALNQLVNSYKPKRVIYDGVILSVRYLSSYYIKANSKIKEAFIYMMTKNEIKNIDPFSSIFYNFITDAHPKYQDIAKLLNILEERLNVYNDIPINLNHGLRLIKWMLELYSGIMNSNDNSYISFLKERYNYIHIPQENSFTSSEVVGSRNFYECIAHGDIISDINVKDILDKAISIKESSENMNFSLSEKQKAAVLIETKEFNHITLSLMNENKEFEDWLILVDVAEGTDESATSYLLFSETDECGNSSSQVMGISLSDDPEKSKNKIIFENLDICSEYEIDFEN